MYHIRGFSMVGKKGVVGLDFIPIHQNETVERGRVQLRQPFAHANQRLRTSRVSACNKQEKAERKEMAPVGPPAHFETSTPYELLSLSKCTSLRFQPQSQRAVKISWWGPSGTSHFGAHASLTTCHNAHCRVRWLTHGKSASQTEFHSP